MAPPFVDIKTRMIMKKEYIKPEIIVEEIIYETPMLSSSFIPGEPGDGFEFGANKRQDRRGTWGDLWAQE